MKLNHYLDKIFDENGDQKYICGTQNVISFKGPCPWIPSSPTFTSRSTPVNLARFTR